VLRHTTQEDGQMAQLVFEALQQRGNVGQRRTLRDMNVVAPTDTPTPAKPEQEVTKKKRAKRPSRRKSQNLKKHPQVVRLSLTIAEWCAANAYSRSFYEKLKRGGRGPDETREGKTVRITPEADAKWRAAREGAAVANGTAKPINSDTPA
jgi:hypothetical protein